jgi:hypothetical protein
MVDEDLENMSTQQLRDEVIKLRTTIRTHRDQKGDENCWLDDGMYLYGLLPEKIGADPQLPNKQLMMQNCVKYYECRKRGKLYKPFSEMPSNPIFAVDWLTLEEANPFFNWPIVCISEEGMFLGYNDSPNGLSIKKYIDDSLCETLLFWFPIPMFPLRD